MARRARPEEDPKATSPRGDASQRAASRRRRRRRRRRHGSQTRPRRQDRVSPRATSCSGWKRISSCFPHKRRPTLAQVEHALADADPRLQLENLAADDDGLFASVLVESPEDHAAVEMSYEMRRGGDRAEPRMGQATAEAALAEAAAAARRGRRPAGRRPLRARAKPGVEASRRESPAARPRRPTTTIRSTTTFGDDFDGRRNRRRSRDGNLRSHLPADGRRSAVALTRGLAFDPAAGEVV